MKLAKKGNHVIKKSKSQIKSQRAAKILTKQHVRFQNQINQYTSLRVNLDTVVMQLSSAATSKTIMECLGSAAGVMGKANADMDIGSMQKLMKSFMIESEKVGIKSDMVITN